jgi:DNA repair exonuclease SbcCD ATPase subunit
MSEEIFEGVEIDDEVKSKLSEKVNLAMQAKLDEETKGLKSKVDELLGEKKRVQQEREQAQAEAKQRAEEKAQAENDYKQLFESQKSEADNLRSTIEKMNADMTREKVTGQAAKIASQLTKDTGRAQLLQQQISQRLTIVDGELRVTDETGQLTVSTLDDLTGSIKSAYPFLVDGNQASGGSATRSQGSAERSKEITRSEFDAMPQGQRASYVKSGGKIVND